MYYPEDLFLCSFEIIDENVMRMDRRLDRGVRGYFTAPKVDPDLPSIIKKQLGKDIIFINKKKIRAKKKIEKITKEMAGKTFMMLDGGELGA